MVPRMPCRPSQALYANAQPTSQCRANRVRNLGLRGHNENIVEALLWMSMLESLPSSSACLAAVVWPILSIQDNQEVVLWLLVTRLLVLCL